MVTKKKPAPAPKAAARVAKAPATTRSHATKAPATTRSHATKAPAAAPPRAAKKAAKAAASSARAPARAQRATPKQLIERLEVAVPEALCELAFQNPFQLLIATILSAQSTDKTVNAVTPSLFARWPDAKALAAAPQEQVEEVIKRTGFFRNKAKSIRGAAQKLVDAHQGDVPRSLDELVALPGVARKTANVVLGTAYGIPSGFVVDTHVARVAARLGFTQADEPAKIERDLCDTFARERWVDMAHRVLLHGRYTCLAKNPMCTDCPLNELCPSRNAEAEGNWQTRAQHEAERVAEGMSV